AHRAAAIDRLAVPVGGVDVLVVLQRREARQVRQALEEGKGLHRQGGSVPVVNPHLVHQQVEGFADNAGMAGQQPLVVAGGEDFFGGDPAVDVVAADTGPAGI